ncbi:MAG TPA: FeoB small GTPase domain-containing protein, partial [Thermoleophilia bacterium]|nr:FeoB small GTPase domain-containing protein [Thermoleophilia bacterium]
MRLKRLPSLPSTGCCPPPASTASERGPGAAASAGAGAPDHILTVCLAGNPNVGKSRLYNRLTGATAEVGNYAGMTVEPAAVLADWHGRDVWVTDLPGAYAVGAGREQALVLDHLLAARPDVVVAVVDAGNLARSLYLVLQLLDFEFTVVVAANLVDLARKKTPDLDLAAIEAELGVPVVGTSAATGEGIGALRAAVVAAAETAEAAAQTEARRGVSPRRYSRQVEARREALAERLAPRPRIDGEPCLSPHAAALAALESAGVDGADAATGLALRIAAERHAAAQALARA